MTLGFRPGAQETVRNLLFELSQSYFFKDQDPMRLGQNGVGPDLALKAP